MKLGLKTTLAIWQESDLGKLMQEDRWVADLFRKTTTNESVTCRTISELCYYLEFCFKRLDVTIQTFCFKRFQGTRRRHWPLNNQCRRIEELLVCSANRTKQLGQWPGVWKMLLGCFIKSPFPPHKGKQNYMLWSSVLLQQQNIFQYWANQSFRSPHIRWRETE